MDISSLQTNGYVTIPYPKPLRLSVQRTMDSWRAFCDLPLWQKELLGTKDRDDDYGYTLRLPPDDHKEMFHLTADTVLEFQAKAVSEINDTRATAFLLALDELMAGVSSIINAFADAVEKRYKLPGFYETISSGKANRTFRLLHYLSGELLAKPHPDKGGFTLHLDESDEGGQYLGFDGIWYPWPVNKDQTIIFPNMMLQYLTQGELKALWHRVTTPNRLGPLGRYAMVVFIEYPSSVKLPFNTQTLIPGSTYSMPFDEFRGMYVPR